MRTRLLPTTSALVFASAACAQGSTAPLGVGGQVSDVTTGSVSSVSVAGTGAAGVSSSGGTSTGVGAAGSGGPASTSPSVASSSSSGGACPDTPCKLTSPQCGCPSGQACSVYNTVVSCLTAGTAGPTQLCGGTNDCAAGLLCVASGSSTSSPGICETFCETDADCTAPGGLCVVQLSDGSGGAIPDVTLCTDNCNPFTNAGCAAAGTSCQVGQEPTGQMRPLTLCAAAGTLGKGMACDPTNNQCAPTFGCFSTGAQNKCYQYCDVANPSCATCTGIEDMALQPVYIGNKQVGICN